MKTAEVRQVDKVWFTRKAAADYLGVSLSYIKKLCLGAKVPSYKVEGLVFIRKDELDRFIQRHDILKS